MTEVVVGIDFGSSGSGFAYAYKNSDEIIHGSIFGANVHYKVPTEIILDNFENIVAFGAQCTKYLKDNGLKNIHYFKGIKMNLYERKSFIKAKNSGKSFKLKTIIQKVLKEIKNLAIKEIRKNRPFISESKIKWVVTVPAIWQEYEKNMMMEACVGAGLIQENEDKSLFFALEPEAASYYCSKNKSIDQDFLKEGKCYIICDLGGGTGDIISHLIGERQNLNELYPASGGNFGSNEIDKLFFEEIIYPIFECKDFDSYYKKYLKYNTNGDDEGVLFNQWCELEREIKDFKEFITNEKIMNNDKHPINLGMFQDIFDDNIDINNLINKYNNKCIDENLKLNIRSKKKWIIEFPYKIIHNYIIKQANSISDIIKNIISYSDKTINALIFVGGYCSNDILVSLIKQSLPKFINVLQPSNPCLSIMEGAVLFGLDPNKIIKRKAKYSIGMSIREQWNDILHSEKGVKIYDEDKGIYLCLDCFSRFIKINQDLTLNQEITKNYEMSHPRRCSMQFYKTFKENPIFIHEKGIHKIGECVLDAGKDYSIFERDITVTMKIGGTFIDVKAIHLKSGNKIKTQLKFD